ncbi:MAG: hypothetical protein LBH74_05210 [Nitrososphaerota archaeon]|jgi:hypothetical protein|uniref:hypothetical protein n=1 Tax=Candidatus Bathycorpusculum sp. TaxID=2994959 RepID=UPI00281D067C|nr:hypothetical protein [Candidatus Termitimicrobium sp.]MCL2431868.1 hypothetical protein [Candidatus Termitimicrobium sp.]MDR0493017.1 hypothetical protein [Nitrososphaerota archaeon]
MNKQLLFVVFIVFFSFSVVIFPQTVCGQTPTSPAVEPTATDEPQPADFDPLLLAGIIAVVVVGVVVAVVFIFSKRRSVNEKSLRRVSSRAFEEWVIKKFNGRPGDSSLGVTGFTEGGQPLLIVQSDHVGLVEVQDFVKLLVRGRALRGTVVAFNFDSDTIEAKVDAMDNEIDLQLLRVSELVNKRSANRLKSLASSQVTFDVPSAATYAPQPQMDRVEPIERMSSIPIESQNGDLKPRVFISNSDTKIADQIKQMLDFLHYDYMIGDKEETAVPIPENKFGLMKNCDCAIITIAAAEQERRYSGLYILNSTVTSEINAAYLKYNTQVILLVERKVELPPNLKGLKRIEYDRDELSFNAAMELEKILIQFKKL